MILADAAGNYNDFRWFYDYNGYVKIDTVSDIHIKMLILCKENTENGRNTQPIYKSKDKSKSTIRGNDSSV